MACKKQPGRQTDRQTEAVPGSGQGMEGAAMVMDAHFLPGVRDEQREADGVLIFPLKMEWVLIIDLLRCLLWWLSVLCAKAAVFVCQCFPTLMEKDFLDRLRELCNFC